MIGKAIRRRAPVWADAPLSVESIMFELEPPLDASGRVPELEQPIRFVVVSVITSPLAGLVPGWPPLETMAFSSDAEAVCGHPLVEFRGGTPAVALVLERLGYREAEPLN